MLRPQRKAVRMIIRMNMNLAGNRMKKGQNISTLRVRLWGKKLGKKG